MQEDESLIMQLNVEFGHFFREGFLQLREKTLGSTGRGGAGGGVIVLDWL